MDMAMKRYFKAHSLNFSLGTICNLYFLFLFIIHQFLYQEFCKDNVICVVLSIKLKFLFMSFCIM